MSCFGDGAGCESCIMKRGHTDVTEHFEDGSKVSLNLLAKE